MNSLHFVQRRVLFGHLHHLQGSRVRQGVIAQVELLEVLVLGQVLSKDLGAPVPQRGVQQGQPGQRAVPSQRLSQVLCPLLTHGVVRQPVDTGAEGNAEAGHTVGSRDSCMQGQQQYSPQAAHHTLVMEEQVTDFLAGIRAQAVEL